MKKSDIFLMALRNLKNRRSRTKLTVIGVVVGTCAIVIMISIGAGINKTLTEQYQNSSSATRISVTVDSNAEENGTEQPPLNDSAVRYMNGIKHVKTVLPVLNMSDYATVTRGRYSYTGGSLYAVDFDTLAKLGVTANGNEVKPSSDMYKVYFGETAALSFMDEQGNIVDGEFDENNELVNCEIDPLKDTFNISPVLQNADSGQSAAAPNRQRIRTGGILNSSGSSGLDTENSIFMDIRAAQQLIKEYNALNNKPNKALEYSEIYVYADSIENVKTVQENINKSGLSTYSNEDELNYTKRIMLMVQLVLGAIGAVSMLVAAFGISNTMVMAVYERTKEIGVMKVIGCDISDIKSVFLCEAGMIGFMGGTIGIVISLIISVIANFAASAVIGSLGGDASAGITVSSVPLWLILLGIGFSVVIGVVSGISPANRAVKVSALKAIHSE